MEKLPRKELIFDMLEKEPNDVFLNYALAMEHLSTGDYNDADAQLRKVLEINPSYLPCYYQLGQVNEKLNKIVIAISYYKQGVNLAKSQNNNKALGELNEAIWMLED
ncbi:MAG: tetratricopeptide repeat protein [Burkholderiales bacterium]|nr:tetratricopeptide repeat protein [Bacteroidia bacterium]